MNSCSLTVRFLRRPRQYTLIYITEIIGWPTTGPPPTRKPTKSISERDSNAEPTMLDRFVTKNEDGTTGSVKEEQYAAGETDVFINEDGTMGIADVGDL
jgi:hypothetical protein